MYKELVVAKYKEDVSWLRHIDMPVFVYDKCPEVKCKIDLPSNVNFIPINNIRNGNEAHSYLFHIVSQMDYLADVTYFVQGDPFEHSPNFMKRIQCDYDETCSLTTQYKDIWPPFKVKLTDKIEFMHGFEIRYGDAYKFTDNKYYHNKKWLEIIWKRVFPMNSLPQNFYFGYGSMWAVPRKRITQRMPIFWEWCLNEVLQEPKVMTAWAYEVLWKYIFDSSKKYKDMFGYVNEYCHIPKIDYEFPCMHG